MSDNTTSKMVILTKERYEALIEAEDALETLSLMSIDAADALENICISYPPVWPREKAIWVDGLLEELEFLRQGFAAARLVFEGLGRGHAVAVASMDAYHKNADRLIVQFSGESVRFDSDSVK